MSRELSAATLERAQHIAQQLQVEGATIVLKEGSQYFLEEELETLRKAQEIEQIQVAATMKAVADLALQTAVADETVQTLTFTAPMADNRINVSWERQRTFANIANPDEPNTKYGVLTSKIEVHSTSNRGEYALVRTNAMAEARELLNK